MHSTCSSCAPSVAVELAALPVLFGSLGCQLADHCDIDIVCVQQMLQYNPVKRISARQAMLHPYFADLDKSAYAHLEK